MEILQIIIPLIIFIVIIIPIGKYIYKVISGEKSFVDPFFNKIDNFIYKIRGINKEEMNWKEYVFSIIIVNAVMVFIRIYYF